MAGNNNRRSRVLRMMSTKNNTTPKNNKNNTTRRLEQTNRLRKQGVATRRLLPKGVKFSNNAPNVQTFEVNYIGQPVVREPRQYIPAKFINQNTLRYNINIAKLYGEVLSMTDSYKEMIDIVSRARLPLHKKNELKKRIQMAFYDLNS